MNEPKRRLRILVIEDSLDTAQTMLYILRADGHVVDFAINGYVAMTLAERNKPDVILIDIGLPDFDGVTLVRRLRRFPVLSETRFIAITGRVSDDDEKRALAAGCERFLRKPVDLKVLDAVLNAPPGTPTPPSSQRLRK
jgi:CheY-like chemotaxis protein